MADLRRLHILPPLVIACFAIAPAGASVGAPAPAQSPAAAPTTAAHAEPAEAAAAPSAMVDAADQSADDDDPLRIFRAPLLREGSSLVEAIARLKRDPAQNWWLLEIESRNDSPAYQLAVLPCTRLTEMERIVQSMPGEVTFKVTGRVYVFRDRNYFLPSHAALVGSGAVSNAIAAPSPTAAAARPSGDVAPATQPSTRPGTGGGADPTAPADSAESIMRELQRQAGPVARSSGAAARAGQQQPGTTGDASAEASSGGAVLHENQAIVNRRGKVTRDRGGGWMFVFDADAAGLSDPPLKLLPCMLLEGIEDYARRAGNNSPLILTGQAYLYHGQSYVLPTVYRIPRESSRITP